MFVHMILMTMLEFLPVSHVIMPFVSLGLRVLITITRRWLREYLALDLTPSLLDGALLSRWSRSVLMDGRAH